MTSLNEVAVSGKAYGEPEPAEIAKLPEATRDYPAIVAKLEADVAELRRVVFGRHVDPIKQLG